MLKVLSITTAKNCYFLAGKVSSCQEDVNNAKFEYS